MKMFVRYCDIKLILDFYFWVSYHYIDTTRRIVYVIILCYKCLLSWAFSHSKFVKHHLLRGIQPSFIASAGKLIKLVYTIMNRNIKRSVLLPIRIAKSNISCVSPLSESLFLSDKGPTFETFDFTIRIGSTPTFLYFDLYLYSAYAAH